MKRAIITVLCTAGFGCGVATTPDVVDPQPATQYTLITADAHGPDFSIVGYYETRQECENEAFKMDGKITDEIPFCIEREGSN